jgi:hypothetical protein
MSKLRPAVAISQSGRVLASVWPPTARVAATAGHKPLSPTEAIRRKCLDCCAGQIAEVRLCEAVSCSLWPFRAGRHPYTKTRLLEADPDGRREDGPVGVTTASPSRTALQEASCCESGAILTGGEDEAVLQAPGRSFKEIVSARCSSTASSPGDAAGRTA